MNDLAVLAITEFAIGMAGGASAVYVYMRAKLADMTEARDCAVASMEWGKKRLSETTEILRDRNIEIMQSVDLLKEARANIATLQAALDKYTPARGRDGKFTTKNTRSEDG